MGQMSDGRHYWNRRLGKSLTLSLSLSATCLSLYPVSTFLSVSSCKPQIESHWATKALLHYFPRASKTKFLPLLPIWALSKKLCKNKLHSPGLTLKTPCLPKCWVSTYSCGIECKENHFFNVKNVCMTKVWVWLVWLRLAYLTKMPLTW